ncbi:MAG: hypothetical protein FJ100_21810 [Deltaproteobacteria bacterium]|nr:hypothetical protein [Deltaproteobacteria bacterium]
MRAWERLAQLSVALWVSCAWAAPPSPALGPDPVQKAQACYATGDLGCVIALDAPGALPDDAPQQRQIERWRLVGFAAARLDRPDQARAAFAHLLRLAPTFHLDRDATPPVVWRAFAAAWLQVHGAGLDLQPAVHAHPHLPTPTSRPGDWPRFAPPPRSGRDNARDYVLTVAPTLSIVLDRAGHFVKKPIDHVGVLLGLQTEPWPWLRAGLILHGVRWNDGARSRLRNDLGLCVHGRVAQWNHGRLEVAVELAGSIDTSASGGAWGAAGAGLRYHTRPARGSVGWTVSIGDRQALGGQGENQLILAIGLALQPAAR